MSELRDVIASVLEDNRLKPPRVQANLVLEVVNGRKPLARPRTRTCPTCEPWAASVKDVSLRKQIVDAAEAKGRLKAFAWWLLGELDRKGRPS